ncbi:hypothetical protein [Polaromonas sp. LjRoot131]|uniref:hypothetical protein n=1 Tax=Polaromonas sp. LjRoot131 TaxID=3342262 RepID=UPI003ECF53E2
MISLICFTPALASLGAVFFLSNTAQEMTGTLQAAATTALLTFVWVHQLFISRQGKATKFLEFWPVSLIRLALFMVVTPFLIFMTILSSVDFIQQLLRL